MRIHIIGASGSGKSCLASQIAEKSQIPHYDLDDIFWNNQGTYGCKRPSEERNGLLAEIAAQDDWVIEGVYYAWLENSFAAADIIYVLDMPIVVCKCRILKRFLRRKLGIEKGKKETVKSLVALLRWTDHYRENNLAKAMKMLEPYENKTVVLRTRKDADTVLRELCG